MSATERVVNDLNIAKLILCNPQTLTPEMCIRIGQAISDAIVLLKEQEAVVRCKDCRKRGTIMCHLWFNSPIPKDDWFCADGERKDGDEKC